MPSWGRSEAPPVTRLFANPPGLQGRLPQNAGEGAPPARDAAPPARGAGALLDLKKKFHIVERNLKNRNP